MYIKKDILINYYGFYRDTDTSIILYTIEQIDKLQKILKNCSEKIYNLVSNKERYKSIDYTSKIVDQAKYIFSIFYDDVKYGNMKYSYYNDRGYRFVDYELDYLILFQSPYLRINNIPDSYADWSIHNNNVDPDIFEKSKEDQKEYAIYLCRRFKRLLREFKKSVVLYYPKIDLKTAITLSELCGNLITFRSKNEILRNKEFIQIIKKLRNNNVKLIDKVLQKDKPSYEDVYNLMFNIKERYFIEIPLVDVIKILRGN